MEVETGKLIAAIKYSGRWYFLLGTIGELILDYKRYDPEYDPDKYTAIYRGNILTLDESNAGRFLEVMREYLLSLDQLLQYKKEFPGEPVIDVLIDFDQKFYVNGYAELPLEKYVPRGWRSVLAEPRNHLPPELVQLL